ncbi:MAG: hypothetical protein H6712_27740 [Myxococcales bacterium]|nr:hypothetical protein [Myxococcales bacterium]
MEISRAIGVGLCGLVVWGCTKASGPGSTPPLAPVAQPGEPVASSSTPHEPASHDPSESATAQRVDPPAIAESPHPQPKPNPYVAPPIRTAGDLTVHAPPHEPGERFGGRLRTHVDGALSKGSPRTWVGPQVPGFVVLLEDTMELFLLDRVGDEFMAFYREPYGAGSCEAGGTSNCRYYARLYDIEGHELWGVALHELLSASTQLEIQDVRYADGTLYFNEACQSYSSGAKGKCSYLVAYDPQAKEIRWRTKNLVSNGEFLIHGDYIVAGYGFTGERDFVYVVSRANGSIVHKVSVPKSAETFAIGDDGLLEVRIYPGTLKLFEMRGWDTSHPKLVATTRKPSRIQTVTR